jgi:integrase
MRRGEAVGLRWEDVDLDDACLSVAQQITDVNGRSMVSTPKSKCGTRDVPIDDVTVAVLRRQLKLQDGERAAWGSAWHESGLVFTREDGRPLRPEFATRHFQALTKQAGLRVIRLHDLRHTNASMALEGGVAMKVVSERLGHSNIAITANLYTHVSRRVGNAAAERIADLLRSPGEKLPTASLPQSPESAYREGGDLGDQP